MVIANKWTPQNLYELLGPPSFTVLLNTLANDRPQVMTVTRTRTRSQHHLQRWPISQLHDMASVMHRHRRRVRLVEELLGASVVAAQDVAVDVVVSLAMMEVVHVLSTNRSCMGNGHPLGGGCYITSGTDIEDSFPRP